MWSDDDRRFMAQALIEARRAGEEGEVPIGAVVVSGGPWQHTDSEISGIALF